MKSKKDLKFINHLKKIVSKQNKNHKNFTWADLAKRLEISKSYLSQILNGSKSFPVDQLDALIDALDLDSLAKYELVHLYLNEVHLDLKKNSKYVSHFLSHTKNSNSTLEPTSLSGIGIQSLELFDRWYYTAILDLVETKSFRLDFGWIAKKLNINKNLAEISWNFLVSKGYLEQNENKLWTKSNKKFRLITGDNNHSNEKNLVRTRYNYYSQFMELTKAQILSGSFTKNERLIQGVTCSTNLAQLENVKIEFEKSLYKSAENLSQGECTDVYYLMAIAIPITQRD